MVVENTCVSGRWPFVKLFFFLLTVLGLDSWRGGNTEQEAFKEDPEKIRWAKEECQDSKYSWGTVPARKATWWVPGSIHVTCYFIFSRDTPLVAVWGNLASQAPAVDYSCWGFEKEMVLKTWKMSTCVSEKCAAGTWGLWCFKLWQTVEHSEVFWWWDLCPVLLLNPSDDSLEIWGGLH